MTTTPDDTTGSERRPPPPDSPAPDGQSDAPSRRERRQDWREEERARRYVARRSVRFPIFTRSVLLWMLIFALVGVAFGGSGAFWWAHFNTQISELRAETRDIETRSAEAMSQIESNRNAALTEIDEALEPLAGFLSESRTIQLAELFAPAVWFVSTLDEDGQPTVGSAFPVATDAEETLFVTSHATVEAAATEPGPEIEIRNLEDEVEANLVSTDPGRDLALLSVPRGDLPVLEWASEETQAAALGTRVFPISGFGGLGASLTSGVVMDQSAAGLLHTAPLGTFQQGGPVVTPDGRVIGVASLTYDPQGFDPGEIHFAVRIDDVCIELLDCGAVPAGEASGDVPTAPDEEGDQDDAVPPEGD